MIRALGGAILVASFVVGNSAAQNAPKIDTAPPVAIFGKPVTDLPAESIPTIVLSAPVSDSPQPVNLPVTLTNLPDASFTGSYTTLPRPVSDAASVNPPPGTSGLPPGAVVEDVPSQAHPYLDNLSLFAGLNGFQEPADLGINSNFGYRLAFNWGFPIWEKQGIGLQVGTAMNYSQNSMRFYRFLDGPLDHYEYFTTVGVFQRDEASSWGAVYDFRFDDYYSRTYTGQWRFQYGINLGADNEIGFWATVRDHGDKANFGPYTFSVQPISQWNVFWRHIWNNEIVTRVWIGLASEHSRFDAFLPREPQINHPATFGTDFYVPLGDSFALYGEAHFITPNDTGAITASIGLVWYPGTARGTARSRFAPLMPLANNTNFALDVR
jgi:hypothetical protein